jgi:hypothetical protein
MFPVQDYYLEIDLYVWLAYASTCTVQQPASYEDSAVQSRAEILFSHRGHCRRSTTPHAIRHTHCGAAGPPRAQRRAAVLLFCPGAIPAGCLPACLLPACVPPCLPVRLPARSCLSPPTLTSRSSALQCLSVARGTTPARLPSYQSVSQTAIACASSTSMQSVSMLRLPTDCFVLASSSKPLPRTHTPHLALKSHPSFFFSLFFFSSSPLLFSHQ